MPTGDAQAGGPEHFRRWARAGLTFERALPRLVAMYVLSFVADAVEIELLGRDRRRRMRLPIAALEFFGTIWYLRRLDRLDRSVIDQTRLTSASVALEDLARAAVLTSREREAQAAEREARMVGLTRRLLVLTVVLVALAALTLLAAIATLLATN
jgi:hypothetical protein